MTICVTILSRFVPPDMVIFLGDSSELQLLLNLMEMLSLFGGCVAIGENKGNEKITVFR